MALGLQNIEYCALVAPCLFDVHNLAEKTVSDTHFIRPIFLLATRLRIKLLSTCARRLSVGKMTKNRATLAVDAASQSVVSVRPAKPETEEGRTLRL